MYLYFCSLCLNNNKNLKSVLIEDNDGIVVDIKIKYCLSEVVDIKPEVPKYICNMCLKNVNCFYKFKTNCLQNNTLLNDYFRNLKVSDESYKHLSVKLTDIIPQEKLQTICSNTQILPVEVTYGEQKDIETTSTAAVCQKEVTQVVDRDTEDSDSLPEDYEPDEDTSNDDTEKSSPKVDENDIEVKEEFVTPDSECNFEFVNCIKNEPVSVDPEPNVCVAKLVPEMALSVSNLPSSSTGENIVHAERTDMTVTLQSKVKKHTFKLFKCTICNREFIHQNSLKYHLQTHADIKNFECSICKKKFRCKSHLVQHENSHTGVKEFKCSICQKSFSYKCSLISHLKTHDGVKNYECTVCRKKFIHKVHLTQHEKIHSGVKEFECPVCRKQFISKAHMMRHKRIHNSIKYSEFLSRNNVPVLNEINNE